MDERITGLIEFLTQIEDDGSLPRNIKERIRNAITALEGEKEFKIRASKALQELDEISDNPNIPSYIRPQIWNAVSMLEGF